MVLQWYGLACGIATQAKNENYVILKQWYKNLDSKYIIFYS